MKGCAPLHHTGKRLLMICLRQSLANLVKDRPGGFISDLQERTELNGIRASLGVGNEMKSEKPFAQRSPASFHHCTSDQGSLMSAASALIERQPTGTDDIRLPMFATRTGKAIRPFRLIDELYTILLGFKAIPKSFFLLLESTFVPFGVPIHRQI
ncbi:Uncharacterised protein [Chlamydia abortus]|nr:Uncharacterised protein [Chlamydia abortus]